jgi:hypothetical protein
MQMCESGVSYRRYDGTHNNSQHFEHVDRDRFNNTPDTMEESRRSELCPRKTLDVSTTGVVGGERAASTYTILSAWRAWASGGAVMTLGHAIGTDKMMGLQYAMQRNILQIEMSWTVRTETARGDKVGDWNHRIGNQFPHCYLLCGSRLQNSFWWLPLSRRTTWG